MRLEIARINKMLKLISDCGVGIGRGAHTSIASVRASVGVKINRICEDVAGRMGSLINNFTPSAIG